MFMTNMRVISGPMNVNLSLNYFWRHESRGGGPAGGDDVRRRSGAGHAVTQCGAPGIGGRDKDTLPGYCSGRQPVRREGLREAAV